MRRKAPERNLGLCIVIPDGVRMDDIRTGEMVIRTRTERAVPVRSRTAPTPA